MTTGRGGIDGGGIDGGGIDGGGIDGGGTGSAQRPPLRTSVEAVLFVADEAVSQAALGQLLDLPPEEVAGCLRELADEYTEQHRGFELREVAGGWRLFTRACTAPVVERFLHDGQSARLSQAALETLAVVAYRQPVGRARVAAIRGVNVDGVVRTLLARGLLTEVGHDPHSGAGLLATTPLFLDRLGLRSLDELPSLAPLLPDWGEVDLDSLSG